MKKTAVALAALLALGTSAFAQSNVQIYGIIDTGVEYVSKAALVPSSGNPAPTGSQTQMDTGILQGSRLGYRGSEDLGGGLRATFNLESGLVTNTGAFGQGGLGFGRKSVVGFAGWIGTLDIGRRKDFIDEVAEQFSGIVPFGLFILRAHSNNMDRVGGQRANNMIYYSTPTWGGFRANVTYGLGGSPLGASVGRSLGYGAMYTGEHLAVGGGYWTSKLGVVSASSNSSSDQGASTGVGCNTPGLGSPGDTCIRTWMAGARYTVGPWNVHGAYSRVEQPLLNTGAGAAPNFVSSFIHATGTTSFTPGGPNNDRTNIVDLGGEYQLGAWNLKAGYIQSRYDFIGAASKGKLAQYMVGADYYFSKRTTLYTMLARLNASNMYSPGVVGSVPGADNSTYAFAVGIRHTF